MAIPSSRRRCLVLLVTCGLGLFVQFSCEKTPVPQAESVSLERNLTMLELGYDPGPGSQTERRFDDLLGQLTARCAESREQIAAASWKSHDMLKESGIGENTLAIMEGLNRATAGHIGRIEYNRYAAGYVTLRRLSRSHSEAIDELQRFGVPK
jgi:hypothetical protein